MPFHKNHKLSTGRPKGSTNKDSKKVRELFTGLVIAAFPKIEEHMEVINNATSIADRIKAMELMLKLSEYILPKLQSQSIQLDFESPVQIVLPQLPKQNNMQQIDLNSVKEIEEEKDPF